MTFATFQAAFNGGEISPSLYNRVNIDRYQSSVKLAKNMFIRAHGGAEKRPGSYYVCPQKYNDKPSRLKRFQFSETQGYCLEFSEKMMRVLSKGGVVIKDDGTEFELATPYTIDDVWQMKFEQSADVIFITHPVHCPAMLKRYGHADWRLEDMVFVPKTTAPQGIEFYAANIGAPIEFQYKITAIHEKTGEESLPVMVAGQANKELSATNTIRLRWEAVEGCKKYNIYRRSQGMFGWISTVIDDRAKDSTEKLELTDNNIKPDFDATPPLERNPFKGAGDYPSCAGIFEQRMAMGATLNDFELVEMSKAGAYNNFTMSNPIVDDDALSIRAAGSKVNTIYYFLPLNELLVMTLNGIWKIEHGSDSNIISGKSSRFKKQNNYPCDNMEPQIIGNTALFFSDNHIRTLGYMLESDGYDGNDISIFATHLFDGRKVVDWTWCSSVSLMWIAFEDGGAATLTFVKEHQLNAFTRYETDGWFESVESVNEDGEESVYTGVIREINGVPTRMIERFIVKQQIEKIEDDFIYLDCAAGLKAETPVSHIEGLDYLEGREVGIMVDGGFQGIKTVKSGAIDLDVPGRDIKIGLLYEAKLRTLSIDYPVSDITGTSQGIYKKICAVNVAVQNSGIFEVTSIDEDGKEEWTPSTVHYRRYGVAPDLATGYQRVELISGFNTLGEIAIRSTKPLPLAINAIMPEIAHGG